MCQILSYLHMHGPLTPNPLLFHLPLTYLLVLSELSLNVTTSEKPQSTLTLGQVPFQSSSHTLSYLCSVGLITLDTK